jgi:restriction endonuclease S subunit
MKGATGRQRLNAEDLALAELPVPPLEEQKRIVTLLDAATERVTELTKCYEQARTHANNLFVSASREVFEGNPDWPVKTLGDVCEVLDSLRKPITKRDRTSGGYPYYGATGIVDYVGDYIFDERLVLVGEDGAKWDSGDRTAFIVEGRYWVNNHAHVLRCKQGVLVDSWLANFLTMSDLNRFVSGLTVPKLNQGSLVSIEIPVPPFEEQKRIVARLDSMRAKTSEMVAAYDAKLTAAKNLRQSILEAAFAGEL